MTVTVKLDDSVMAPLPDNHREMVQDKVLLPDILSVIALEPEIDLGCQKLKLSGLKRLEVFQPVMVSWNQKDLSVESLEDLSDASSIQEGKVSEMEDGIRWPDEVVPQSHQYVVHPLHRHVLVQAPMRTVLEDVGMTEVGIRRGKEPASSALTKLDLCPHLSFLSSCLEAIISPITSP